MMVYQSTRDDRVKVTASQAILRGIAEDGGLFVPEKGELPKLRLPEMINDTYPEMAVKILSLFLNDFSEEELAKAVEKAYGGRFDTPEVTPLKKVGENYVLELFHGPTAAFKDVALCLLPQLMILAKEKQGVKEDIVILTATSGDTGKAALEGFKDVKGTKILVFFPEEGVSSVQKAQMVTQAGSNVKVVGIRGNFDEAQTGVKEIFRNYRGEARLSSANSINIGRLIPQMVYYLKAYQSLVKTGRISLGTPVDFAVPTGNFGDILAGYMMKEMGLPVGKLLVCSNRNHVLTDFFMTGIYDRNREFAVTESPSMDILISSNLERLLYLYTRDTRLVASCMEDMKNTGRFTVSEELRQRMSRDFAFGYADEVMTKEAIRQVFREDNYLMDPHTAVAWSVAGKIHQEGRPLVVLSTASAYKFPGTVMDSLGIREDLDDSAAMEMLSNLSKTPIPKALQGIWSLERKHKDVIYGKDMRKVAEEFAEEKRMNEVVSVEVRVPATTANMGPGFDCFGCAFNMYNVLNFEPIREGLVFEGFDPDYCNEDNLAVQGYAAVMSKMREKFPEKAALTGFGEKDGVLPGLRISIKTNIPICRGLGSSSSLLAAAAIAANVLHDSPFATQELLEMTTEIEGHPDNLAPCLLGGMTASMMVGDRPHTVHYFINPTIKFVALIPDFEFPTSQSRAALPKALVYQDAVYNIAHGGILLKALENGDEELISLALSDRLHEPYRKLLIPGSQTAEKAAKEAGAMAFCLSGAGPTFMCLSKDPEFEDRLREKMAEVLPSWRVQSLAVDYVGATYKKFR